MIELSQISTLVTILDKSIKILQGKSLKKKEFFDSVIEPLHRSLEPVCVQYFSFLRHWMELLRDDKNIKEVIREVRDNRDTLVFARINVTSMAEALREQAGKSYIIVSKDNINLLVLEYSDMIKCFFFGAMVHKSIASRFIMNLEEFELTENASIEDLIQILEEALIVCEDNWLEITKLYGRMRIESYS